MASERFSGEGSGRGREEKDGTAGNGPDKILRQAATAEGRETVAAIGRNIGRSMEG